MTVAAVRQQTAVRGHILFAIGVLLVLYLAFQLLKELEIIYVSALFAVVLMPLVMKMTTIRIGRYHPSRGVAILVLLLAILLFLALFFTVGLPPVISDLKNFLQDLPQRIPAAAAYLKRLPIAQKLDVSAVTARAENLAAAVGSFVVNSLPMWLSHLVDILTGVFLCIYFMLEGEIAYTFALSLVPENDRRRLDLTLKKAELKMSKWLFGQGLLMLILGVSSTIVFGLLHVRYFVLLGAMMGLFNIIPIAGAVFTVALAALAAALDSWTKMAGVLIFYAIYVNLENAVLTPRIMKSSVDLSGLTVLVALLLGSALAGITGALVAVPTAALVAVLLEEYAVNPEPPSVIQLE
jgi:predicted PurR-regulated permease PerM